ncbi:LPXTG-motif cell wall anchor domain-containing protein [Clostridium collagenovorans DSM 3089]|uniref:LPXTG-motif cell wall anchor domain-containing protein n=1 Tax=Clostridium collagenovorans DSM 3089 TaxID=1121306 RepID=A0A1M5WXM1_9CLOT|nr:leucine-rich repeat domain-containing protein [Clostridium collagenovorans]SHH92465.1 LPXTG-motif cell wall anchor domain-containing protein [Clostridium collagenovorans DSM 3089]
MKNVKRFNKGISALVTATLIAGATPQIAFAATNNADLGNASMSDSNNSDSKYINVSSLPKIESTELGQFWESYDKYRISFPGTSKEEFPKFEKYVQAINATNDITVNGIKYDNVETVDKRDSYSFGLLGFDLNPSAFTEDINTILIKANSYNTMKIKINKDGSFVSQEEIKSSTSDNTNDNSSTDSTKPLLPTVEKVEYSKFYSDFMKCRISFISQTDDEWKSVNLYREALNSSGEVLINEIKYNKDTDVSKENTFSFSLTGLEVNPSAFKEGLNTITLKTDNYKDLSFKINKFGETMNLYTSSEDKDSTTSENPKPSEDIVTDSTTTPQWKEVSSLPKITNTRYGEIYGRVEYEITFDKDDAFSKYLKAADPDNPNTKLAELTVNGVRYHDNFNFGINEYHLSYIGGLELNDKSFNQDLNTIILKVDGYNDMRIKIKKDGTLISQEEFSSATVGSENIQLIIRKDLYSSSGEAINLMDDVLAFASGKEKIDLTDKVTVDVGNLDIQNPKAGTYEVTYSVTYNGQSKSLKRKIIVSNDTIPTDNLEDGVYTIGFKALRYDIPENESMLGGFFDEKVKVTVDNGEITLTMLNIMHASTLLDFSVESNGTYSSAKGEFKGETDSKGEYQLQTFEVPVSDLTSEHVAAVLVGMMGGSKNDIGNYSKYTKARLVFNKNCSKGWDGFNKDKEIVDSAKEFNKALISADLDIDGDGTVTDTEISKAKGVIALSGKNIKDISRLKNLGSDVTELYLSGNNIKTLPNGIFDNLTNLEKLSLSSNGISELPEGIFDKLTKLEELSLSQNYITELPNGILDNLKNLTSLGFTENKLTKLPDNIFDELTSLTGLFLYDNNIKNIPTSIGKLKNLTNLSMNKNKIEIVPEELGELSNLTKLSLNNNLIKEIPNKVYKNLKNLTNFDIYDNELTSVPDNIKELLPKVSYFDFKLNKLSKKPSVAEDKFYPQKDAFNLNLTADNGVLTWTQDLSSLDIYIWSTYMDTSSSLEEYTTNLNGKTSDEYLREKSKDWRIITEIQKKDSQGKYVTLETLSKENEKDNTKASYSDKNMKDGDEYKIVKSLISMGGFENRIFTDMAITKYTSTNDSDSNTTVDPKPDVTPDTSIDSTPDSNSKDDNNVNSNTNKDVNTNTKVTDTTSDNTNTNNITNKEVANSSKPQVTIKSEEDSKQHTLKESKLPKTGSPFNGTVLASLGATLSALGIVLNKKSKKKQ